MSCLSFSNDLFDEIVATVQDSFRRDITQPAGTSLEGPLGVATSGPPGDLQGTLRGPRKKMII